MRGAQTRPETGQVKSADGLLTCCESYVCRTSQFLRGSSVLCLINSAGLEVDSITVTDDVSPR